VGPGPILHSFGGGGRWWATFKLENWTVISLARSRATWIRDDAVYTFAFAWRWTIFFRCRCNPFALFWWRWGAVVYGALRGWSAAISFTFRRKCYNSSDNQS
jgi:hypothetical protein